MALFLILGAISGFPQYLFYNQLHTRDIQSKKKDTCSNPG
jgi:hypothetical protein